MMTDKILCLWCGAEMEHVIYNDAVWCTGKGKLHEAYHAFYRCRKCGAQGPVEYKSHGPAAEEAARAAALRRYTPPIKPMTLEEVQKEENPVWVEGKNGALYIGEFYASIDTDGAWNVEVLGSEFLRLLLEAYYNKTWRCWERRPTDEERSAAEWEK